MARRRILYGLALAGSLLFFIFYRGYLSHLVLFVVLLLPVFSLLAALPSCFLVRVRLELVKTAAGKGEPVPFFLHIQNRSVLPCPAVRFWLECRNLLGAGEKGDAFEKLPFRLAVETGPRSETALRQTLTGNWCGKTELTLKKARVTDVLGIFSLPVRKSRQQAELNVLPAIQPLAVHLEQDTGMAEDSGKYSPYRPGDDPGEVFQIREFREGDNLRRIHWKLSRRIGQLMVRDFSLPADHGLCFLLEPGVDAQPQELDRMLEGFASLSSALAQEGCVHHVGWMEESVLHWEEVEDLEDLGAVLARALALRRFAGRPALSRCMEEGPVRTGSHLLYCTTPGDQDSAFAGLEMLKREKGCRRVTILFAGPEDAFSKAPAFCRVMPLGEGSIDLEELLL